MAFIAPTEATFVTLDAPNYNAVGTATAGAAGNAPQVVNSAWTHPNPYVVQIGNHLFHKEQIPSTLKWNDKRRDKEVLDNLRNKVLRRNLADPTPSFARQAVPRPAETTPFPFTIAPNSVADTMTKANAPFLATVNTLTVTSVNSTASTALPKVPQGKPFSPLATPVHHSGLPYSAVNPHPAYAEHGFTVVGAAPVAAGAPTLAPPLLAGGFTSAPTVVYGNTFPAALPATTVPVLTTTAPAVTTAAK